MKSKPGTFDLLEVESKVRLFEENQKGFRNMANFADEMKQLEYLKKLQQNKRELDRVYTKRMRRISNKYKQHNSIDKLNMEAKKIISDLGGLNQQFAKIVAMADLEQRSQVAHLKTKKTEGNQDVDAPLLEKNTGHLRLSGKDILGAASPKNLPTCLRKISTSSGLLEKVQNSKLMQS